MISQVFQRVHQIFFWTMLVIMNIWAFINIFDILAIFNILFTFSVTTKKTDFYFFW